MTEPNLLSTDPAQAQVIEQEVEAALLRHGGVADCAVVFAGAGDTARRNCVRCGITGKYPGLTFDAAGVCSLCVLYEENREQIDAYWGDLSELAPKLRAKAEAAGSEYDCLLLFSGGKDSTYVLYRLVDLGLRVMTFTFDNGFISTTALRNVEEVTGELGIEHVTKTRADQNKIFLLSLQEHKSVCNGCFRSLLDLSTELAHHRGIPSIVTGLSRGQIMDERLSWFHQQGIFDRDEIEEKLALGRRVYHQSSGTGAEAAAVDAVEVVDFYRYSEVTKDEIRALLKSRSKIWAHPDDTGFCSSNCLINDVGVYVHAAERGFHNYEAPTRWEVRLGHLSVAEANEELQGPVNSTRVKRMLAKIGYPDPADHPHLGARMTAYYVPNGGVEESIRAAVAAVLPEGLVPERWVAVGEIPRTAGVVDRSALKAPVATRFGRGNEDSSHPLTPSQLRVTERTPLAEQARALLVTLPGAVDTAKVKKIVLQLLMQHDAMRMKFTKDGHEWRQQPAGTGGSLPVVRLDLSAVGPEEEPALLRRAVAKLRSRLDPAEGRVLQVTALERGARPGGLLLVLHELAADTASWRLLLEDVVTACRQLGAGEPVELARSEAFPGSTPIAPEPVPIDPGPAGLALGALAGVLPAWLGTDSVTVEVADHTAPHHRTGRIVGRLSEVGCWRVWPDRIEPVDGPAEIRYDYFGDVTALLPPSAPVRVADLPEVDFTELPGSGPHRISVTGAVRDGKLRLTWQGVPDEVARQVADRLP